MKWLIILIVLLMCTNALAVANVTPSTETIKITKGSSKEYRINIESLSDVSKTVDIEIPEEFQRYFIPSSGNAPFLRDNAAVTWKWDIAIPEDADFNSLYVRMVVVFGEERVTVPLMVEIVEKGSFVNEMAGLIILITFVLVIVWFIIKWRTTRR